MMTRIGAREKIRRNTKQMNQTILTYQGKGFPQRNQEIRETQCSFRQSENREWTRFSFLSRSLDDYKTPESGRAGLRESPRVTQESNLCFLSNGTNMVWRDDRLKEVCGGKDGGFNNYLINSCQGPKQKQKQNKPRVDLDSFHMQHAYVP